MSNAIHTLLNHDEQNYDTFRDLMQIRDEINRI